jgi:hypothetical protein
MWWLEWVWNHVPWYVPYIVIIILIAIFWNVIAPFWALLPKPIKYLIGFILAIFGAVQYGRNRGVAAEQQRRKTLNEHAIAKRDAIDEHVKNMPDNAVTDKLKRNGWLRDD